MSAAVRLADPARAVGSAPGQRPAKSVEEAARQFEALLIGQLLKGARGDDEDGWLGSGSDAGSATAAELAEEQFAQALARSGGLGLSAHIVSSLTGGSPAPRL